MKIFELRKGLREALWSASDFVGALKAVTPSPHSRRRSASYGGQAKAAAPQLKLCCLSVGVFFALVSVSAFALDPSAIDDVLAQTVARQEQVMQLQLDNTYPASGLWHHEDYALAAYGLDTNNAIADAGLIACQTNGLYQDSVDAESFHWHAYLLERIYFLHSGNWTNASGRMGMDAETAVLEMLWDWASTDCVIGMADPAYVNYLWGSENHHLQRWVSCWGAAHIFADHPLYSTYTYSDGTTPAEMAAAFDDYFTAWLNDRSVKGLMVEVNSPIYAKYSLNTLYNLADFATDPELKAAASSLLDIYFADWALEQIDGVRGGSRHRCYSGQYSNTHPGGGAEHAWYQFGTGLPQNTHPGSMSGMTTLWRPSRATVGLALDTAGRGSYGYTSRRLGLVDQAATTSPVYSGYALDPDGGSLLRTTWCTPDFVMGMSQMEARNAAEWTGISSQNRWNGVIFGGHDTARIFTQRPDPASGSVYNAEWGVQHKGAMILQHLKEAQGSTAQMVWFDGSLSLIESEGWIFAEAPRAYAAVKIVDGGWSWDGNWAVLTNRYSPIIIETGRKQDYGSIAAFQSEILSNPISWDGARIDYASAGYDATLTLFADESAPPQVDGVFLGFNPEQAYDSPYMEGDFGAGPVIISYGDERTVHGIAPFNDDANTLEHWDFETTVPAVHADSTNSVYEIADGKFDGAVRCDFEAGDQYMMTADAWPADQGAVRYQGWIRLNPGDTGGTLFHVYDQVNLSVDSSSVTFWVNRSGNPIDVGATNLITLTASISTSNAWQYIEAVYDGTVIKLVTEEETVSAPGIGPFAPNNRNVYIGSRKNKDNYVGDMDEVKISSSITELPVVLDPIDVVNEAEIYSAAVPGNTHTLPDFTVGGVDGRKLVVCTGTENGGAVLGVSYGGRALRRGAYNHYARSAEIWYLDDPEVGTADIVVTMSAASNSTMRIGALSLAGAEPGMSVSTNAGNTSTDTLSLDLTTTDPQTLVVGSFVNNLNTIASTPFTNTVAHGSSGSSFMSAGYTNVETAGLSTYAWSNAVAVQSGAALAGFAARPELLIVPAPVVVAGAMEHYQSDSSINTLSGFSPATGSGTKLVVCASWEGAAVITNISYGSQRFTRAIGAGNGRNASIWYLDEPVAASGDVVVQFSGSLGSRVGVLSLQHAAAGDPAQTASAGGSTTINLFSAVKDSLAVGVYTENGDAVLSSDFANTLYSGGSGSSQGNAGYQAEAAAGPKTYSWNATTNSCMAVAVSCAPVTLALPMVADDGSDADADGMTDSWEIQQFGNLDASDGTADSDVDGFTDAQEFSAGTDPRDAASRLEITGLSGGSNIYWQAVQGKSYRIWSRTNLVHGSWVEEASGVPGTPPESSHVLPDAGEKAFYRIETE